MDLLGDVVFPILPWWLIFPQQTSRFEDQNIVFFRHFLFKKSNHHHVPQSQKSLKSHSFFLRRDALFVDICNILSFPEPASEKKPAPAVTKQDAQNGGPEPGITVTKQEAPNGDGPQRNVRCNVKSASTPSTPVKVSSRQISKSSGLMKLGERGGLFLFRVDQKYQVESGD